MPEGRKPRANARRALDSGAWSSSPAKSSEPTVCLGLWRTAQVRSFQCQLVGRWVGFRTAWHIIKFDVLTRCWTECPVKCAEKLWECYRQCSPPCGVCRIAPAAGWHWLVEIICTGLVEHVARICKNQCPGHRTSFQELLLEHLIGDSPAPKLNRWCGALRSTVAVHSFRKILVGGASVVGRHEACDSNPDGVPTNSLVWSTSDHFCVPAATSRIIWPMKQMRAIALPW